MLRIAPHRIASDYVRPRHITSYRTASHQTASHHTLKYYTHHIVSYHLTPHTSHITTHRMARLSRGISSQHVPTQQRSSLQLCVETRCNAPGRPPRPQRPPALRLLPAHSHLSNGQIVQETQHLGPITPYAHLSVGLVPVRGNLRPEKTSRCQNTHTDVGGTGRGIQDSPQPRSFHRSRWGWELLITQQTKNKKFRWGMEHEQPERIHITTKSSTSTYQTCRSTH